MVEVFAQFQRGGLVAKDAEAQATLDAAEAARQVKLAKHIEEKEARREAFLFMRRC